MAEKIAVETPYEAKVVYINVLLLNKRDVVASKVAEKTGLKGGLFNKAINFAANKVVTDEKVIASLAETLVSKILIAVNDMGIKADIKKKFQKGAFVVVRVHVQDVDKLALILGAKGPEFASSFSALVSSLSSLGLADTALPKIDKKIQDLVHNALITKFAEAIPQKMAEQGLEVQCDVKSSEDQADFFFEALENFEKFK
jgi:hypothetical protein